ncbi:MAG TPA: GTP-binding protein [Kiritimatiellia bacterium]|nr:GTP-binding protein [Kiritimatiellia bacterium]
MMPPVPLIVFAGFLGAGKTTVLRDLLPRLTAAGLVPHVLVNDYRNAMIDAQTLRGMARTVEAISGTCVCCESKDDLLNTLATLTLPAGSVLLLEANGTADTAEIIELLTADRRTKNYTLPVQVTVVDAKRYQKRFWNKRIESVQVKTANLLIMTRRDEVNDVRWETVRSALTELAPRASFTDPEGLAVRLTELVRLADHIPPRRFHHRFGAHPVHTPHPHHHHHHFASLELQLPPCVTRSALSAFLMALPPEVIRAKGVAVLDELENPSVVFQKVEGRDAPTFMALKNGTAIEPSVVMIGAQCPADQIERLATEHLSPAFLTLQSSIERTPP